MEPLKMYETTQNRHTDLGNIKRSVWDLEPAMLRLDFDLKSAATGEQFGENNSSVNQL